MARETLPTKTGIKLMTLDSKWLEILKASGWQTTAIAATCGLFLLFAHWGWLPPLAPWMIHFASFGSLLCGFLAFMAILSSAPVQNWIMHWITIHKKKRAVRDYIPHMTEQERKIISYLLAKNQKTFTYTIDGGYAVTLISRGIVVCSLKPDQAGSSHHIPFDIPDHIWSVFLEHKNEFPYKPPPPGETEMHPWSIHWMLRGYSLCSFYASLNKKDRRAGKRSTSRL
jgi:hypothetical protein